MTKRKTDPVLGATGPEISDPPSLNTYNQALHDLGITVPVYACRLVGSRLEFRLYGGRVVFWPPMASDKEED